MSVEMSNSGEEPSSGGTPGTQSGSRRVTHREGPSTGGSWRGGLRSCTGVCRLPALPPYFSLGQSHHSHLEWEFRSDSISRCFCCWRLVRPAGEPAAEDDALLARGKSQLILLQSPGPRPSKVPAYSSWLSPVVPGDQAGPGRQGPRLLPHATLASPWLRRVELALRPAGINKGNSPGGQTPVRLWPAPPGQSARPAALPLALPPGVSHLPTPPSREPRPPASRHHAAPSPGRARSDVAALGRAQPQLPFPLCRARGVYGAPAAAAGTATATAAGCYLYGEEEEEERELRDTSRSGGARACWGHGKGAGVGS